MANNITAANATGVITVDVLYSAGFQLEGFATDQALVADEETIAESRMGIDGKLSAGYTPSEKLLTVSLEAWSPAAKALQVLQQAQRSGKTIYKVTLVFNVPSIKQIWTYVDGHLKSAKPTPDVKKTIDKIDFKFGFEDIKIIPTGL